VRRSGHSDGAARPARNGCFLYVGDENGNVWSANVDPNFADPNAGRMVLYAQGLGGFAVTMRGEAIPGDGARRLPPAGAAHPRRTISFAPSPHDFHVTPIFGLGWEAKNHDAAPASA
jgi:hypothetical protein